MIEKDDWKLLNNTSHLYKQCLNPIDGTTIMNKFPSLSQCVFCWDKVKQNLQELWYLPLDQSCCICEDCFKDFQDLFQWKHLDGWDIDW